MSSGSSVKSAFIVFLGSLLIRALASTWRIRVIAESETIRFLAGTEPMIHLLWHGDMLPLLWQHRDRGIAILISEHRDGELIARVGERLGSRSIRGSSSRGAERALIGLIRELRAGGRVAITPDGPRGPRHSFAPGALVAAQKSGAPMIGHGVACARAWRLGSWDRFLIPKPFATVVIAYTLPLYVRAMSTREVEGEVEGFRQQLLAISERAAQAAGARDA